MIIPISRLFTGEKFRMLGKWENPTGQTYEITAKTENENCSRKSLIHLTVDSDPNWDWCIHGDTQVFLITK